MNSRTNKLLSWKLVIAGPDEQGTKGKLKGISEKLKLKWCEGQALDGEGDADLVFLDAVHGDSKWRLMKRAEIFVLPSRSENFGMVVGEALSCGVPVVTTAVGPWGEGGEVLKCESSKVLKLEENLETGYCPLPVVRWDRGLCVVETSVEGIADGLQRMMALSDEARREMGAFGCAWVKEAFSWEHVAKRMVDAYRSARQPKV